MPINYARRLTGSARTARANQHLGWTLAFIAGATNAGAFLAVRQYTSHMTGMISSMADNLTLGQFQLAIGAFGALASFLFGAALLLLFGVIGAQLAQIQGLFVSMTVMLLCFIMGLQNAVITKISKSEIRTTHVTGLIFQHWGYAMTIPLATILVVVARVPTADNIKDYLTKAQT